MRTEQVKEMASPAVMLESIRCHLRRLDLDPESVSLVDGYAVAAVRLDGEWFAQDYDLAKLAAIMPDVHIRVRLVKRGRGKPPLSVKCIDHFWEQVRPAELAGPAPYPTSENAA
jgi:hypothetical protein